MARDAYTSNGAIARRVYRALKTPTDNNRRTDPILAFHFKGRGDSVIMRCNKEPEISVKGKDQTAGEVKFFAYSDFSDYDEGNVVFNLKDEVTLVELYGKGSVEPMQWESWEKFTRWLDTLSEDGIQISLKLPCLVYESVRKQKPSMQNFIVESIKRSLKGREKE
ncbi:MAG: hypothetical protein L0191_10370 [Acidobacteria bacterium]|nr:hypothetical protein [Acidobacteriota bacterium]MCI0568630.1 hypothetical protein [Acidobacteriota bacterium]